MKSRNIGWALAATLSLTMLGFAGAARATIINISATTANTTVGVSAGQYLVQWIGVADGGLYDGANVNCPGGVCSSGWSEAFGVRSLPLDPNDTINFFGLGGYSSALAALSATQSNPINSGYIQLTGGVFGPFQGRPPIAQPWIVTLNTGSLLFFVPDGDHNLDNNVGGVSLRITAVPEPSTWMMMLLGVGAMGAVLRGRRKQVSAHA